MYFTTWIFAKRSFPHLQPTNPRLARILRSWMRVRSTDYRRLVILKQRKVPNSTENSSVKQSNRQTKENVSMEIRGLSGDSNSRFPTRRFHVPSRREFTRHATPAAAFRRKTPPRTAHDTAPNSVLFIMCAALSHTRQRRVRFSRAFPALSVPEVM